MKAIADFLAFFIRPLYALLGNNYGLTIIMFTIVVKLATLPLSVKSQKSMTRTQQLQPLIAELQKKYKNDKNKLNEEMTKLYTKHNVNPLGGCLPTLVPLIVLFGLISVIYQPFTYILQLTSEQMIRLRDLFPDLGNITGRMLETKLMEYTSDPKFAAALSEMGKPAIGFNFFGVNIGQTPSIKIVSELWIIPALAVVSQYLSGKIMQRQNPSGGNEQAAQMNKSMMTLMPLMTAVFVFQMPVAASLYWFISSVTQTLQQIALGKYFEKKLPPLEIGKKKKKPLPTVETTGEEIKGENKDDEIG